MNKVQLQDETYVQIVKRGDPDFGMVGIVKQYGMVRRKKTKISRQYRVSISYGTGPVPVPGIQQTAAHATGYFYRSELKRIHQ